MDQMRAQRMATLPRTEQVTQYTQLGRDYLAQGLLPEAEQQFQSALTADPNAAAPHAGLAQVREQSGAADDARSEAQVSIRLSPSAAAFLVLARLDLQANNLSASADDVSKALKLEPQNTAAIALRNTLQTRGQNLP
jgi:Tfp pilus assembly protein PilF